MPQSSERQPCEGGIWKLNFDAAMWGDMAYLAAACRNSTRVVKEARGGFLLFNNPLLAKTQAALLACQTAEYLALDRVIFEGDSPSYPTEQYQKRTFPPLVLCRMLPLW